MDSNIPIEIQILFIAVVTDLLFGDPPNKLHPTAWIGSSIMWMKHMTPKSNTGRFIYGAIIAITIPSIWAILSYLVGHVAVLLNDIANILSTPVGRASTRSATRTSSKPVASPVVMAMTRPI